MRIGAVNYLNSKPLVYGLERFAPAVQLGCDLPSRLADSLAAGRWDVALVPSIEYFRRPDYRIVSDACVACRGPVLSVKLHFRVPPAEVKRLALDEGSRTSAALAQILLRELVDVAPECEPLPIGCGMDDTDADAVLLIGDRAIVSTEQGAGSTEIWDLGERWTAWTGLPFVFAMWVARPAVDTSPVEKLLAQARDQGVLHLAEIAAAEAPLLGITVELATRYLRENLHFTLLDGEAKSLRRFGRLCRQHGLVSHGVDRALERLDAHGCATR